VKLGSVIVEKKVTTRGTLMPLPAGTLFPMTLTCTPPPQSWTFSLTANGTYTANNIPYGSTCTVTEGPMPAFPPNICPRGTVPAWLPPPSITPASVVINGTTITMIVHNSVTCEKRVCPPPQIMNAAGVCVCPPPMLAGPVPGSCICPQGTTLVNGKCEPVNTCQPPLILLPGGACGCPDHEVLVGKECVKRIVCKRPLVPNAAGTACICLRGRVLRHGKCVETERPKHERNCKRGYFWNGEMCVKRTNKPRDENHRERPGIGLPGFGGHGGGSRDRGEKGGHGGGEDGAPGLR
jgi:Domain of unknown function (DUF5979)